MSPVASKAAAGCGLNSTPDAVFLPSTVDDLVAIITLAHRYRKQVRAAGAGHSPSDLACVDSRRVEEGEREGAGGLEELVQDEASWAGEGGWMIRMDQMNEVYEVRLPPHVTARPIR